MAISFIVIILMRCCAGIIIWTLVFSGVLALVACTVFLFVEWSKWKVRDQTLTSTKDTTKLFEALMIISLILTLILLILVIALRNRIRLCVAVFKEASRATARMPQIFLTPFLGYIFMAGLFVYWIWVYLYMATSGTKTAYDNGFVYFKQTNNNYRKMWWYHLFGLLWTSQFIIACGQLTLAGMGAMWYFTRDKSQLSSPLIKSVWRLIRYHLGSVIFGALLIALVELARIILAYIQAKLKGRAGKIVDCILCCLRCCLWCFEKCLKFINKNAYIEIAIWGKPFCTSACNAFATLLENILRVGVINSLGNFVLFLMKMFIVACTAMCALGWLRVCQFHHFKKLLSQFLE